MDLFQGLSAKPTPGETYMLSLQKVNSYFWLSLLFLEC